MSTRSRRKKNKKNGALIFIGILIVLLSFLLYSYITSDKSKLTIDKNAIKEEDNSEKMDVSEGGGAASLTYSNIVTINKEDKEVNLYLKNPGKSREDLVLEIYLNDGNQEKLIAKSDLIPTGYAIHKLDLEDIELDKEKYEGYMTINFYNEDTKELEIVNSKINIEITVE